MEESGPAVAGGEALAFAHIQQRFFHSLLATTT